jgi:hypothetical protein
MRMLDEDWDHTRIQACMIETRFTGQRLKRSKGAFGSVGRLSGLIAVYGIDEIYRTNFAVISSLSQACSSGVEVLEIDADINWECMSQGQYLGCSGSKG